MIEDGVDMKFISALDYEKIVDSNREDNGQFVKREDEILDLVFRRRFGGHFLSIGDLRHQESDGNKSET